MNETSEPKDIKVWIQELITHSAMEQMRVMQRFNEVMRRVARGELDPQTMQEEIMRFAQEEAARYVGDLTRLSLSFYSALLNLSRGYNDRLLEHLTGSRANNNHSAPTQTRAAAPSQVEMALQGAVGQEIVKTFVVENKRTEMVEISFLVSEFVDEEGAHTFRPPLQLQPARFALRPGEERVVTLRLPLLTPLFAPGRRYQATVVVRGYDDLELLLDVWIESTPPAPAPPTGAPNYTPVGDDLSWLKGIGPRYARKLYEAGILTYAGLAALDEQALTQILGPAARRSALRNRWFEQARLAAAGDSAGLEVLQKELVS